MRLLIVEDEVKTGNYLQQGLTEAGFIVDLARTGLDGHHLALTGSYDVIILDVMLPDVDGWRIMQALRDAKSTTPVLFLTARDSVEDRVKGLELGADDYLVKPFAFSELLARVRTLLRRGSTPAYQTEMQVADLVLDIPRRRAVRQDVRINLTNKEFALLELLVRRQGEVLPRSLIASQVWDMNFDSDTTVIDVAIRRLRAKIDDDFDPKLIHMVRGMGYMLDVTLPPQLMKRRPASLAVRLTVSIGAVITVVLLTFGWIVERSINNHFIQQDVDELNAVVQALKHTLATLPPDIAPAELNQRFANAVSGHHNAQYRISSDSGALIYATPGSNLDRFAQIAQPVEKITVDTVGIWQDHGETFRGAVLRSGSDSFPAPRIFTIAVATGINFHLHYLDSFRDYLRIITVAACLIAILATWLAVHQGHAPIRRISREIRKIRSDQLHIRLEPQAVPTELVELAMSFNGMLERLEDVFRRLSDFSGDIAHELRTPITNLKT